MFFGIVLVIIGAILLLSELGIIHNWSFWSYLWPVLIIAVGVRMIVGDRRRQG